MSTGPKVTKLILAWTPSRMVQWATHTGPHTARLFERILASKPNPEMSYRSCLGLIRLAEQYTPVRMEAAAERALLTGACRYQHVKSMLEKSLDRQPLPEPTAPPPRSSPHDNIRGAEYFGEPEADMLEQPMMEKLMAMRLPAMMDALRAQQQDSTIQELSFMERLGLLVDQQWSWRENQALARRMKMAKLRANVCIEDIDYRAVRGLDKSLMRALTQESLWVRNHENIFVLGPTGVGKSFVACALAQKACRDGYTAFYTRAAVLFRDLALARADGSFRHLLARLSRIDVLVVDDWAMARLNEVERRDFWEICEDRYQARSLILTSQLPVSRWHEQVGDATVADGILDRIVHNAHRLEMRGGSMRKN